MKSILKKGKQKFALAVGALGLASAMLIPGNSASAISNSWSLSDVVTAYQGIHLISQGNVSFSAFSAPGTVSYSGYASVISDGHDGFGSNGSITATIYANAKTICTTGSDYYTWAAKTATAPEAYGQSVIASRPMNGDTRAFGYLSTARVYVEADISAFGGSLTDSLYGAGDHGL